MLKANMIPEAVAPLNMNNKLDQGGPTFFFPRAKNSFPVGPKGQETPPGTVFENYSQFSLSLTTTIQK
jgi:hypothetical protein